MDNEETIRTYYFGCWSRDHGHFLYTPDHRSAWDAEGMRYEMLPWGSKIDGGLCPRIGRHGEAPQGQAQVTHTDGWTALAFWDRTCDSRGNSHSTFVFEGTYDFDAALVLARDYYPALFRRYTFQVVPYVDARKAAR